MVLYSTVRSSTANAYFSSQIFLKVDKLMKKVSKHAGARTFAQIPEFSPNTETIGLDNHLIVGQLETLASALDGQADVLGKWREHTVQLLLKPLVDEDDGMEITGDEYEESTRNQDEIFCYVQALRAVISDRYDTLTGQHNELIAVETKTALRLANESEGPFPLKTLELLQTRQELKTTENMGSVRGIVAELRSLATSLRPNFENGNKRALTGLPIVELYLGHIQKQLSVHTKITSALEREIELFTNLMNHRVEYYRQLQQVSDAVEPYQEPINDGVLKSLINREEKVSQKIATLRAKRRYLEHLQQEASNPEEQRICAICRDTFEIGSITVCGHQYCKECIAEWWHSKLLKPALSLRVPNQISRPSCMPYVQNKVANARPPCGQLQAPGAIY